MFWCNITTNGINSLLKRLGFVYKKPVLTPCKADVKKQEEFIEQYKKLKDRLEEKDQIYFIDGVHPQHNSIAGYGWIKRGKTKQLKTNNGRKRTNIKGHLTLKQNRCFTVEKNNYKRLGRGFLDFDAYGTFSPDGKWMVTDTYPGERMKEQKIFLMDMKTEAVLSLGRFRNQKSIMMSGGVISIAAGALKSI